MIHVENLTKDYRVAAPKTGRLASLKGLFRTEYAVKRAVDGVSFDIAEGEIVGYLGKNGAGKSTTIKMLSGILQPTSGMIRIGGIEPHRERARNAQRIGVVFGQKTQLWWDVPLIESYRLLRDIYRIDSARFERNMKHFTELLEIDSILSRPVRQLSLGQRVKADIVAALLHDPPILFLDEPTIGVDIVSKKRLHDFILEVNKQRRTTIILTTHDIGDMEKLCSRIMLIDQGKLLFDGTLADMRAAYGHTRELIVSYENQSSPIDIPLAKSIERGGEDKLRITFDRTRTSASDILQCLTRHCQVLDLETNDPSVEEIVRSMYERA